MVILDPHLEEGISARYFGGRLWTLFVSSSCSFCSSEGAAIGDIDGGGNNDFRLLRLCRTEPPATN